MSTVNIQKLIVEINSKLIKVTNPIEVLRLTKAVEQLKIGVVFTSPSFSSLPSAKDNIGKLFLVESENTLYVSYPDSSISSGAGWVSVINIEKNTNLYGWGIGSGSRLGIGYRGCAIIPYGPVLLAGGNSQGCAWCCVSFGNSHGLALKTDGTLWTWGQNLQGRLGDGTTVERNSPGTVAGGGTNWCAIQAFAYGSSAIKTDGTLWTWGCNGYGQLGDGTLVSRCSPGTVLGDDGNWCQVGGMRATAIALKKDGTVWTWGGNGGRLGNGLTVSRLSPGTIWGSYTSWVQVSAGSGSVAAIKNDGTLWTWGSNSAGYLANGNFTSRCSPGSTVGGGNWCQVCMAFDATGGVKCDGTLWMWGCGAVGVRGNGFGDTIFDSSPGTVLGGGNNWCKLSVWFRDAAAIKTDGTIWSWGCNRYGQLGLENNGDRCSPTKISSGENEYKWCDIAIGPFNGFGIANNTQ